MTQRGANHSLPVRAPSDCWRTIGVQGDRSCGLLEEHIHCRNCPVFAAAGKMFFDRAAPEGYEQEWTHRLRSAEQADPGQIESVLVFRVGPQWLAVDLDLVAEVASVRRISRIPHRSNRVLMGLVNIRGELCLCASIHGLFEMEPQSEAQANLLAPRRMVVLQRNRARWVFSVDEVAGIRRFAKTEVRPVSHELGKLTTSIASGLIQFNGMATGHLDGDLLWAALERSVA